MEFTGMEDELELGEPLCSMGDSPRCYCGYRARMKISWTKSNPGRRFFGCPKWSKDKLTSKHCNFFCWYDQEICKRSKEVLPELKLMISDLNLEIERKNYEIERGTEKIIELEKSNEKLQIECAKQSEEVGRLTEVIALLRRKDKMCTALMKVMLLAMIFVFMLGQLHVNDSGQ